MVHIDNNKFNILTVTSLQTIHVIHADQQPPPQQHRTTPVITTTWENIRKVASRIILIILIIAQTMKPFTSGTFDEEREKC